MLRRFGLLLILFSSSIFLVQAQGVPAVAQEAALAAAEGELGTRAAEWRWTSLQRTRSSTLGCPLLEQNEALPEEVTPYRFELTYSDGIYVVHVSADGTVAQLCDAKFGIGTATETESTQEATTSTTEACVLTTTAEGVTYVVPSFDQLAMFRYNPGETYTPFGMTDNRLWYRVQQDAAVGWINVMAVEQSASCASFAPTVTVVPGGEPCFITPIAAFSNVRARPSETSEVVDILEENTVSQARARSTDALWYFIEFGWVSTTVTNELGTCGGVLVNDGLVGTGPPEEEEQVPADTSIATILQDLACPPNFEGYLPTRLTIGRATARMDDGGVPNTLRSYPTTDNLIGERLGTVQPSRTFDRVINGPVCNLGFVWWYVEIDGIRAWTAESSAQDDDYFIVPTNGNAAASAPATPLPPPTATQAVQQLATAAPTITLVPTSAPQTVDNSAIVLSTDTNSLQAVAFNNDGTAVYTAGDVPGFGNATAGAIQVWNIETQETGARLAIPSGIIGIAYLAESNQLVVGAGNGTLSFYDGTTLAELSTLTDIFSQADQAGFAFSADETQFTITDCTDETCTTGVIQTYDVTTGELLWDIQSADHIPQVVRYNEAGNLVATIGMDSVRIWQAESGEVFSEYILADDVRITDMMFYNEAGSQFIIVGCNLTLDTESCEDGRIELIETGTVTPLGQLTGISSEVIDLALQSDFTRGASALREGIILVFNSATGQTITSIDAPDALVIDLAYSPDDTLLAVVTDAGQLLVYPIGQDG